uniref:PX domain-containing protein n=1 Tax=Sparus aurata TaxID=8175 RepID=A0A671TJ25_SPAAU
MFLCLFYTIINLLLSTHGPRCSSDNQNKMVPQSGPEPSINHESPDDHKETSCCSSLTTKELQQNWRAVKQSERPVRLLFEIPSARIIEHTLSKHVVYEVVVMRSGSFDSRRVSVERRYSDFSRFHHKLLEEFDEELEESRTSRAVTGGFQTL